MTDQSKTDSPESNAALLRRGLLVNSMILSVGFGLCCGFALLLATVLSIAVTGANAGLYLNLLGVFMPGYTVSASGALIGFFWAFTYAALSGFVAFQIYIRAGGNAKAVSSPRFLPTMHLSGRALGLALGSALALQLFASSAWLIVRGTAEESSHAALLANYLPGYSVTWLGAAIGALWLFLYALLLSMLLAWIYNALVARRERRGRHV